MEHFKNRYVVTFLCQHACAGKAGRTGSDDGNLFAVFFDFFCFVDFIQTVFPGIISHETFQPANGYRFPFDAQYAAAFALLFLGADPATDSRETALFFDDLNGGGKIPFRYGVNKFGNVNVYRAAFYAAGLGTVEAALGFFYRSGFIITQSNFFKVVAAYVSRLFRHRMAVYFKHLQSPPQLHSTDS